jgi:hypothetical protein
MSQQRLGAAQAAKDAATKSIIGGVTGLAGSVIPQLPGAKKLASKGKGFWSNMLGGGTA